MKLSPATQLTFLVERKARKLAPAIERRTHIALADLIARTKSPGWIFFHVPNGELRSKATGALLKRMGERPGVSDFLFIAPPMACVHALELKREGLKPSPEQLHFLHEVREAGGRAEWTDRYDRAVEILVAWGAIRPVRVSA